MFSDTRASVVAALAERRWLTIRGRPEPARTRSYVSTVPDLLSPSHPRPTRPSVVRTRAIARGNSQTRPSGRLEPDRAVGDRLELELRRGRLGRGRRCRGQAIARNPIRGIHRFELGQVGAVLLVADPGGRQPREAHPDRGSGGLKSRIAIDGRSSPATYAVKTVSLRFGTTPTRTYAPSFPSALIASR